MLGLTDLRQKGFARIPSAFPIDTIEEFRSIVTGGLSRMGQTRAVAHSRHLAGFHRFPEFASIATNIRENPAVTAFLLAAFGPDQPFDIGLTDITVNRSQDWHTDLLRGPYASFLDGCDPWAKDETPCLKVLVYLQPGKSLRLLPGSHLRPSPLDDGQIAESVEQAAKTQLDIASGDVVILDIRTVHRGSTDEEMADTQLADTPKILVSMVFGATGSRFAQAMRDGNLCRMAQWDQKFLPSSSLAQ
ncbi:MAG: hypothetical protein B7Z10_07210 [Rhodobacterales bacterium 32-66-7]|nr:MAG: hypothetical protein B7Z10_07210 [Rhodobacterales bacterium 32-66-7]